MEELTLAGAAPTTMTTHPSPYDTPELYDFLFEGFDFDLPFWRRVAREAAGPLLDVGCGSGRVLLRLAAEGVDADGLDASVPMIARLHQKAVERKLKVNAVVADMRDFALERRYARVFSAFNAFAHLDTPDDQIRMLRCCREHLLPGGALVIHISYPGHVYWSEPDGEPVMEMETKHPETGRRLQLWDTRTKDMVAQRQQSVMELRELDEQGQVVERHASAATQRWVYRYELELLFRLAGFTRSDIRGGFDDEPLERPDQQMLAWAWRE